MSSLKMCVPVYIFKNSSQVTIFSEVTKFVLRVFGKLVSILPKPNKLEYDKNNNNNKKKTKKKKQL